MEREGEDKITWRGIKKNQIGNNGSKKNNVQKIT